MPITRPIGQFKGSDFYDPQLPIFVNRAVETHQLLEHRHDFLEISYVSEGSGTHHVGKRAIHVSQGDVFLIPVGVSHVFRPSSTSKSSPLVVYNCVVSPEAVTRLLHAFPGGRAIEGLLHSDDIHSCRDHEGEYRRRFQRLYDEYASDRPLKETALFAGVLDLLLLLYRHEAGIGCAEISLPRQDRAVIENVTAIIRTRCHEPITMDALAQQAGIGVRQLHRLFVKHTGMSGIAYVQNVRIEEACRLLRTSDRKVSDIAAMVGYSDIAYFNKLFLRKAGQTPRQYRRAGQRQLNT
jgi:AraC family transcriptional regulator, L-rhamnose operon transcriptional activator RhaR